MSYRHPMTGLPAISQMRLVCEGCGRYGAGIIGPADLLVTFQKAAIITIPCKNCHKDMVLREKPIDERG